MIILDSKRAKYAAEWFYNKVFGDESIAPRFTAPEEPLPSPLRAARSLETGMAGPWQNRAALFLKQGKLLAGYEDDYVYEKPVLRYFPTYQALSDQELRGYFTWRTGLRRGDVQKTELSFAFLYIYELLNQIGVESPEEGYRKLLSFRDSYGKLDDRILPYLHRWLADYPVYYRLDPSLLTDTPQVRYHNSIAVLADIHSHTDSQIIAAVKVLAPSWLGRSKFYKEQQADMEKVLIRVLKKVSDHYAKGKRTMAEQFFGNRDTLPVRFFESAVFYTRRKNNSFDYCPDNGRIYHCRNGVWTVERYGFTQRPSQKLEDIIKTVDAVMRPAYGYKAIQKETEVKWLHKLIAEQLQLLQQEKQEAQRKKITIDYSQLASIRRDAAITRDKLIVEEYLPEMAPLPPAPEPLSEVSQIPADSPLSREEYRLLQCLLYGGSLDWVRQEGFLLSVLADSINETLFDTFSDTVLTMDDPPALIEDYIQELKEMVAP